MKTRFLHVISALFLLQIFFSTELLAQRNMEKLDRGLVAVKVANGVFLSWRVYGTDPKNVSFNVYRGSTKVNASPITGATNLIDGAGASSSAYTVRPILNGVEQAVDGRANTWASQVLTVNLKRPSNNHQPNDCSVGDLDGDGQYEIIVKWYPNNAKDNSQSGVTDNTYLDAYKLDGTFLWRIDLGRNIRSGAHYTQFLVGDYDSDGKAEIACKTAPGTKDGKGNYLSKGPAANDNDAADYRNAGGYVLSGPEYLTIFNGETGAEMSTVDYVVPRGNVGSWGDTYGNRLDRYNATNAYLDGKKPSMVFQRGYYTRMVIAAFDWDGTVLKNRWTFDSNNAGNKAAAGNGNHSIMAADIDGDGFDEILTGSACIDHDGKFKWSTGHGHGDANHVGDLDPTNPGLEIWQVSENKGKEPDHYMIDGKTGKVLWGAGSGTDNGRGMTGDIDARYPGSECWSSSVAGTFDAKGNRISTGKPSSNNFRVYWDGDLQDETLDGNKIDKWNGDKSNRLITLTGNSCNSSKSTPNLVADILGDWREEVILHDGASKLYITTTTIPTPHKVYTLMHDPVYRNAISWQQSSYNQPPHLGYYLGAGVDKIPTPNIVLLGGGTNNNSNTLPNVSIDIAQTTFIEPANVAITATASDADGTVAKVDFYSDGVLIGTDNAAPYAFTFASVAAGTYAITAVATDNKGGTSTSATRTITVNKTAKDCAGVLNGTAYLDNCNLCVGGTTGNSACATFETEKACEFNGVLETIHLGYKGDGYVNGDNAIDASIKVGITSTTAQTIELYVRYANGGIEDRPAKIRLNGVLTPNSIPFTSTVEWTTWTTVPVSLALKAGYNEVIISSSVDDGLPNIDLFGYTSSTIDFNDCIPQVDISVTLKAGWNMIGCPIQGSTDIDKALSSIWNNVESVKDNDGFYTTSNPAFLNSLTKLEWGKGYMVKVKNACELTWTVK